MHMRVDSAREASLRQEIGNSISHGVGAALAIAALVILVSSAAARGDAWQISAYAIFGASMVFLYLASALYHGIQAPRIKRVFEILDHAAIYVLIAGSYSAYTLTILRNPTGWWVFGIVWGLAACGIVMETLFLNRWPWLTLAAYLAMGWLIVVIWGQFSALAPRDTRVFLILGGLSYSFGTIFYALSRRRGWFHIAWHIFVIGGSAFHFFSVMAALPHA